VRELRILSSAVYKQWQYEPLLSFLTDYDLPLKSLIHAELPIEKVEEALQMAASRDYAKILYRW
jgi:threonine dehydrogenase-like Zn-dependent dehydrogenase